MHLTKPQASKTCDVCRRRLNAWNHRIGSRQCLACERLRTPESQLEKIAVFRTPEDVRDAPTWRAVKAAAVDIALINLAASAALFFPGQMLLPATGAAAAAFALFVFGAWRSRRSMAPDAHLLDIRRWKAMWESNVVVYLMCLVCVGTLGTAFFPNSSGPIEAFRAFMIRTDDGSPGCLAAWIAATMAPALVSATCAVLCTRLTDAPRVNRVATLVCRRNGKTRAEVA